MNQAPTHAFKNAFSPKAMRLAWERYIRTHQREAKDYIGIKAFGRNIEANLHGLSADVCAGRFRPTIPAKVFKPKASGMQRTISILRVEDALVYQALANRAAFKTFDSLAKTSDFVFGAVLHPSVKRGLKALDSGPDDLYLLQYYPPLYKKFLESAYHVVKDDQVTHQLETDITSFYDSIPHYNLMEMLRRDAGFSGDMLALLQACLNMWSGTRDGSTPGMGIPQAADASHFLANYFLLEIDQMAVKNGLCYFRYMDDIRIYGHNEEELRSVLVDLDRHLKRHGLSLNSKKTSVDKISEADREADTCGFNYGTHEPQSPSVDGSNASAGDTELNTSPSEFSNSDCLSDTNLRKIALQQYREMEKSIAAYAKQSAIIALDLRDPVQLREFKRISYRFREAAHILKDHDKLPTKTTQKVINGWCNLLMVYYWASDHFTWALQVYEGNAHLGKRLMESMKQFQKYEYPRSAVYQCLAVTQKFSTRELKMFLRMLDEEESWFVKKNLYLLLLLHHQSPEFLHLIIQKAKEEQDSILFREVAFMIAQAKMDRLQKRQTLIELGVI